MVKANREVQAELGARKFCETMGRLVATAIDAGAFADRASLVASLHRLRMEIRSDWQTLFGAAAIFYLAPDNLVAAMRDGSWDSLQAIADVIANHLYREAERAELNDSSSSSGALPGS